MMIFEVEMSNNYSFILNNEDMVWSWIGTGTTPSSSKITKFQGGRCLDEIPEVIPGQRLFVKKNRFKYQMNVYALIVSLKIYPLDDLATLDIVKNPIVPSIDIDVIVRRIERAAKIGEIELGHTSFDETFSAKMHFYIPLWNKYPNTTKIAVAKDNSWTINKDAAGDLEIILQSRTEMK